MPEPNPIYDLPIDAEWPEDLDWREEEEDDETDDDEDIPTPGYVKAILGFDPDELFADEETAAVEQLTPAQRALRILESDASSLPDVFEELNDDYP